MIIVLQVEFFNLMNRLNELRTTGLGALFVLKVLGLNLENFQKFTKEFTERSLNFTTGKVRILHALCEETNQQRQQLISTFHKDSLLLRIHFEHTQIAD